MIKNAKRKIKTFALTATALLFYFCAHAQDSILIEYFSKTIGIMEQDSMDDLDLRISIFELINSKAVAKNYSDILKIIGNPMHIYKKKNGDKILFYPIVPLFRKLGGGSDLFVFFLNINDDIISDGHIYFIETDEDFYYWIDVNMSPQSIEGGSNVPPGLNN